MPYDNDPIEERQSPQKTHVPAESGLLPSTIRRVRVDLKEVDDLKLELPNPAVIPGKTISAATGVSEGEGSVGSVTIEGVGVEHKLEAKGAAVLLQNDGERWFKISEDAGEERTETKQTPVKPTS